MLFDGIGIDMENQIITTDSDALKAYINKFIEMRHLESLRISGMQEFLAFLTNTIGSRVNGVATYLLDKFLYDKENINIVVLNPLGARPSLDTYLITDEMFKEIFGSYPGDFLKAANNILQDISNFDQRKLLVNHNITINGIRQMIHINGKIICGAEHLQMADIGDKQLERLLRNIDSQSSIYTLSKYINFNEDEKRITFFNQTSGNLYGSLGILYILSVNRDADPYYKPSLKRYELFLTEENELKLTKK